jgi:hypothetical protein
MSEELNKDGKKKMDPKNLCPECGAELGKDGKCPGDGCGFKKKKKKKASDHMDAMYDHIAVIVPRDKCEGGSFEYEFDSFPEVKGIWCINANMDEGDFGEKVKQRIEFNSSQWTVKPAKQWLDENEIKYTKFISAEKPERLDSEKATSETVQRVDFIWLPPIAENIKEEKELQNGGEAPSKFNRTDEGFLSGRATVTNIGVFPYVMADGTIRNELRLPAEIFKRDSLDSLKLKPITNNHPKELVDSTNIKKLSVGTTGEKITHDAYNIMAPLLITDQKTIEDIKDGKRALSCGYLADIEEVSGVWGGVSYDVIQRNIRYNHVAVVDRGRAGDEAVIKLDSQTPVGVFNFESQNTTIPKREDSSMSNLKNVKLDGVDYQAEAKVIETLNQTQEKLDTATAELETIKKDKSTVEADRDTKQDRIDALEKELEETKKVSPEKIDEAVTAKIKLLGSAEKAGVEVKDDMSDTDIKKAIILTVSPEAKEKLDSADEIYLEARYDGAMEIIGKEDDNRQHNNDVLSGAVPNKDSQDTGKPFTSDEAYNNSVKAMKNAWKGEKEE